MFKALTIYFERETPRSLERKGIDFKSGKLSYDEFVKVFAKCLYDMKKSGIFDTNPSYDWMQGQFREKHPEIFIAEEAPSDLKHLFYRNRISFRTLYGHKEYIPYLIDKDITDITGTIKMNVPGLIGVNGQMIVESVDFIKEYSKVHGNEKTLNLIAKYGEILNDLTIDGTTCDITQEESIEKEIRKAIYKKIIKETTDYSSAVDGEEITSAEGESYGDYEILDGYINFSAYIKVDE